MCLPITPPFILLYQRRHQVGPHPSTPCKPLSSSDRIDDLYSTHEIGTSQSICQLSPDFPPSTTDCSCCNYPNCHLSPINTCLSASKNTPTNSIAWKVCDLLIYYYVFKLYPVTWQTISLKVTTFSLLERCRLNLTRRKKTQLQPQKYPPFILFYTAQHQLAGEF